MLPRLRELLQATGKPYIIENVPGAPLVDPVRVCGSAFPSLKVMRHRIFESNVPLKGTVCDHDSFGPPIYPRVQSFSGKPVITMHSYMTVTGNVRKGGCTAEQWKEGMGIDWMTIRTLVQAIPPPYTEFLGKQLLEHIREETIA